MRLIFFLALRQLMARKLLNGIAVGGVAMGVLVLLVVNAVMQGFQMKFKSEMLKISPHVTLYDRQVSHDGTILAGLSGVPGLARPPGATSTPVVGQVAHEHPREHVAMIKRPHDLGVALAEMPAVKAVCLSLVGQAILSLGGNDLGVEMRGVTPGQQEKCTPISSYVQHGSWRELAISSNGVALGSGVAGRLGARVGDQLRLVAPGGSPQNLKVVAVYESGVLPVDEARIYTNITTAQTVLRRPDAIGRIEMRLHDPFGAIALAERLERTTGYDAESWQEANANFLGLFDTQNFIARLVIMAVLAVGGFGILSIMIMIVLQKTRDIAILRSVGLRRADILLAFLIQGVIVAIIGGVLGDLFGWRLIQLMSTLKVETAALVKSSTMLVYEDRMYYLYGLVFALVTGVAASLLPALRGSQVEPVDVLRGQI